MKTPKFQPHKVKRMIDTFGVMYQFNRDKLNAYKESTGEQELIAELKGVLHSTASYVTKTATDGSTITAKQSPQILTNDPKAKLLHIDDKVIIDNCTYKVTGVLDINMLGLAFDISLEVVLWQG
jgi:hypothetical protein